jgi:hypothetical protein
MRGDFTAAPMGPVRARPMLFVLSSVRTPEAVLQVAATAGFQAVQATYESCELAAAGAVVHGGLTVSPEETLRQFREPRFVRPSVVLSSGDTLAARNFTARLVLQSEACIGNLETLGQIETVQPQQCMAFGIARFCLGGAVELTRCYDKARTHHSRIAPSSDETHSAFVTAVQKWAGHPQVSNHDLLHRLVAPCALVRSKDGRAVFTDPLDRHFGPNCEDWLKALRHWLDLLRDLQDTNRPLILPVVSQKRDQPSPIVELFPQLFATSNHIATRVVEDASFFYLHDDLRVVQRTGNSHNSETLRHVLCRVRSLESDSGHLANGSLRAVEPGVGRAALIEDICMPGMPELHDFTVLGVGLTPFSQGGYVEIGREIDGKASLVRAWHRKECAERLELQGCRTGRVLAIIGLDTEGIEMPDGTLSPSALIVRGFRSAYRVKQLDPLICCLHSIQHTPLVYEYLLESLPVHALQNRFLDGGERLASQLEAQLASQESLRLLVGARDQSPSEMERLRLRAIEDYAPMLLRVARTRLALELGAGDVPELDYLRWFAASVGRQLRKWRDLRFLHDYHHPGVSRWSPGHLYTLGENNVTLLAEFPDLDTGIFVDDDPEKLHTDLQLFARDVDVLRGNYTVFHGRDVAAAQTVVITLAGLLNTRPAETQTLVEQFWDNYGRDLQ